MTALSSGRSRREGAVLWIGAALMGGGAGSVVVPGGAAGTTGGVGDATSTGSGVGGGVEGGCPAGFPTGSSPCDANGLECTYPDGASGSAGCPSRWVCSPNAALGGHTWGLLLPDLGTNCPQLGIVCWYWSCLHPSASTSTNATARCDASLTWTIEQSSSPTDVACDLCDQPLDDGDPCDPGRDYALCSTIAGLVCGTALYDIACVADPGTGQAVIVTSHVPCP